VILRFYETAFLTLGVKRKYGMKILCAIRNFIPKIHHQEERMKTNQKEKKQRNEVSQKELLAAIAALEEIVAEEMPKEWEQEEEVAEEAKAKNKIRKKLVENEGRSTRTNP